MTLQRRVLGIVLLLGTACTGADTDQRDSHSAAATASSSPRIRALTLIDSVQSGVVWDPHSDSTWTFRYAVHTAAGTDTLQMILHPAPVVAGDSAVIGLILVDDPGRRELFKFVPGRELGRYDLPDDVYGIFHDIAPSPDGRYLAYVAADSSAGTFAVVRDLHTGRIVVRGSGGGGCDCDVDTNHARWISADSFEIAVAQTSSGKGWQIVSGRIGMGRMHSDTIAAEPDWH